MGTIYAIALNTFREISRDKVVHSLFLFVFLVTIFGIGLANLSIDQEERIVRDLGLAAINLAGGIVAIFAGCNLVCKESEKPVACVIFSKPVSGLQFIAGKYLGIASCLFILATVMGLFLAVFLSLYQASSLGFQLTSLIEPVALVYLELLFVTALATFFSSFATPIMSFFFSISVWFISHFGYSLRETGKITQNESLSAFNNFIYSLLPDLASLTRMTSMVSTTNTCDCNTLSYLVFYIASYILLLLVAASTITERREF